MKGKRTKKQEAKRVRSLQAYRHVARTLQALRLPIDLIALLREGRLEAEVLEAYEDYDRFNALLDAWEIANPELYKLVPWYSNREKWKADGRRRPPWYQLLGERVPLRRLGAGRKIKPLHATELDGNLLYTHSKENARRWHAKQKTLKARKGPST